MLLKTRIIPVCILLAVFVFPTTLFAVSNDMVSKKQIAVLDITYNNVPASYAKIVRNSIEYVLFSTDDFNLLERQHIDTIIKERKLHSQAQHSTNSAIKIGKTLATDFIILGSIDKLESYKISIRVVSVKQGKIVAAYSKDFKNPNTVDQIVNKLTKQIARDIKQFILTGKIEVRFLDFHTIILGGSANLLYPVGEFGDMVNPGFGFNLTLGVDNLIIDNSVVTANFGYYTFEGTSNNNDSATLMPLKVGVGYRYYLLSRVYVMPAIYSGINISILKHEVGDGFDMDDNTSSYGFSPLIEGGAAIGFAPSEHVRFELGGSFAAILESGDTMLYVGLHFGVQVLF